MLSIFARLPILHRAFIAFFSAVIFVAIFLLPDVSSLRDDTGALVVWKHYITQNHPSVHSNEHPPDNILFIECLLETGNGWASNVIHDIAHSRLGDDDIQK